MRQQPSTAILANDFRAEWREVRADAMAAIDRVGESGWLVLGEEVEAFENELARWWGVPHAVGVASGLDALEIALRCAGVGAGDRVLTTPLTAFATTLAILRVGAEPVWSDVDTSGALDLSQAEMAVKRDRSIKFMIPVHLYGHPIDPTELRRVVDENNLTLIEDCAQSAGADRAGQPTGLVGQSAALSLYPTKNLGALGDGGAFLTADAELAARARTLRNYGQESLYRHTELGLNSRLDEIQAAVLRSALLPRLDNWLGRRAEIAQRYAEGLEPVASTLRVVGPAGGRSAHHLFPVEVLAESVVAPDEVLQRLRAQGIRAGRHYPVLCSDQPATGGRGTTIGGLPTARRLAQREISLPMHPFLSDAEIDQVVQASIEAVRA